MKKRYAFLWHVTHGGSFCESAETETKTVKEAETKLRKWLQQRIDACTENNCDCKTKGAAFIVSKLRPKMIMSGMTQNMVTVR